MTPDIEARVREVRDGLNRLYAGAHLMATFDLLVRDIESLELLADGPKKKAPPAPEPVASSNGVPLGTGLAEFLVYAERAAQKIEPGKVSWEDSPLEWMRAHSARVKSMMAKDIVRDWFSDSGHRTRDAEAGHAHFLVDLVPTMVHIGFVGKEARIEFSQLFEDGHGVERILLLGIEPVRVRLWEIEPRIVSSFPVYKQQADGLHHCTIDPEEVPSWTTEIARWEEAS